MTKAQVEEQKYITEEEKNDDFYTSQRKAAQEAIKKETENSAQPSSLPFAQVAAAKPQVNDRGSAAGAAKPKLEIKVADKGKAVPTV